MQPRIVFLCSECFSTTVLYNYISRAFPVEKVIVEQPMRGLALAKKRWKKLGWFKVTGQVLFSVLVVPLLKLTGRKRKETVFKQYQFDERPVPETAKLYVDSVNDDKCINTLVELRPDVVIVNGTRIISKRVLESVKAVFINMHTGITPKYRGVHGGYWAVVQNDLEQCGVTVHLVDKGIDTGGILFQQLIPVTRSDNFYTYPFLQFGEGLPLMLQAVKDAADNKIKTVRGRTDESGLWSHPTIWQYFYHRLFRRKK